MITLKALIIDDEIDICVLLSGLLKNLGIKASFAVSLKEGDRNLSENEYNILFLDNNLPDGSGLEQLPEFKNKYPELIIIMISAYDGDKEKEFAERNGAIDFISKPLSGNIIKNTLTKHFTNLNL
ncbi:MAG TPA: response regulator [Bacteroidia bacterium]|nr:response regulator [Bacteroidia bacterium]